MILLTLEVLLIAVISVPLIAGLALLAVILYKGSPKKRR